MRVKEGQSERDENEREREENGGEGQRETEVGEHNESERDGGRERERRGEKRLKLGTAFQNPASSSSLCQDQGQHQDRSMDKRASKHPLAASTRTNNAMRVELHFFDYRESEQDGRYTMVQRFSHCPDIC